MPISKRLQLTATNPTMQKFLKLTDLADELGISLSFRSGNMIVYDRDRDAALPTLYIEDIENQDQRQGDFPPKFEYRLVYDSPEYILQEKKEYEAFLENLARLAEQAAAQKDKEEQERKALLEAKQKAEDLKQLALLKAKYPNE